MRVTGLVTFPSLPLSPVSSAAGGEGTIGAVEGSVMVGGQPNMSLRYASCSSENGGMAAIVTERERERSEDCLTGRVKEKLSRGPDLAVAAAHD